MSINEVNKKLYLLPGVGGYEEGIAKALVLYRQEKYPV